MSERDDNFLSRWSRRKAQVRQGVEPPPAAVPPVPPVPVVAATELAAKPAAEAPEAAEALRAPDVAASGVTDPEAPSVQAPPKPTLDDVEALTPESDFSRYIARDVDEKVKNSAMKKLFSDPHYNVMDGLDTYIDDYNTPDPLPKAMLRQLVQARMLGLLDDEMPEQPAPEDLARAAAPPAGAAAGEDSGSGDEEGQASQAAAEDLATADAQDPSEESPPAPEAADAAPPVAAVAGAVTAGADAPAGLKPPQPVGGRSSSAS